jgi:hypothetical protein
MQGNPKKIAASEQKVYRKKTPRPTQQHDPVPRPSRIHNPPASVPQKIQAKILPGLKPRKWFKM